MSYPLNINKSLHL